MIVPMKKVCLVVQESFCDIALNKMRDIGVVHIENKEVPVDINSRAQKRKVKVDDAIGLIRDFKLPKVKVKKKKKNEPEDTRPPYERRQKPIGIHRGRRSTDIFGTEEEEPFSLSAVRAPVRPDLSDYMLGVDKERKILKERDIFLSNEIKRIESWGDFDPKIVKEINDANVPVFFYEIFNDDFENLDKDTVYIKVKTNKTKVFLIVFDKEIKGIEPLKMPDNSLDEYLKESETVKAGLSKHDEHIKSFANRRATLDKEMAKVEQDIEFENAIACMDQLVDLPPELKTETSMLSWLTGYVPAEDIHLLKEAAVENNWGLLAFEPSADDEKIPTKLKNNKFINLLTPVTDFLGLLPGYRELDISVWFLIFFTIFFGMIFADAAYGAILTLIAIIFIIKSLFDKNRRLQNKPVPQGLFLLLLLGISNTAWGVLTCAWFGLELDKVPQILKDLSLPMISEANGTPKDEVTRNLQIFCFSLGLVHLSIAHLNNFFKYIKAKSPRCISDLGIISMLFGIYNLVLLLIVGKEYTVIPEGELFLPVLLSIIGFGFLLNFTFGSYETSMKQAISSSLQNSITMVLGIVSLFSDIMSYIRLWAVSLAGAAIAGTVNLLVGGTLGSFLVFLGIILFVFGHGMNMVLCVLSVLVHGVRLNTLEFSGHVGLNWSGRAYKPSAKIDVK